MKPVRIVHLIDNMDVGGAEMMLFKLLSQMDRQRFENIVISMMPLGVIGERVAGLGGEMHLLGMKRGRPSASALFRLIRLLRTLRPDVLQTWLVNADLAGLVAGRLAGVRRIVWNIRGSKIARNQGSRVTRLSKQLCARLSRYPAAVISNSEAGRRAHEELGYRPRQWQIIPNGFDLGAFRPDAQARIFLRAELGIPADAPVVGTVGRYHPMKDQPTFVEAARRVHALNPSVHFVLAGPELTAQNSALTSLAPELLACGHLHLLGAREDVARLLAALDLFALTSVSEGFPNVIGEAMACEVPCVVTETAGDAPLIVEKTGLVVPARDPEKFAAALSQMLCLTPEARRRLGEMARERIRLHYSLASVVDQYEEFYWNLSRPTQ